MNEDQSGVMGGRERGMSSSATAQLSTNDHFGQESWVLLEKGCCMPHKYSIISTVREYRSTAAEEYGIGSRGIDSPFVLFVVNSVLQSMVVFMA